MPKQKTLIVVGGGAICAAVAGLVLVLTSSPEPPAPFEPDSSRRAQDLKMLIDATDEMSGKLRELATKDKGWTSGKGGL